MVGGFAHAADLISAEYGWTDEIILDTPIRRLRQINEVIRERRSLEDFRNRAYIEWQTKNLAYFFASLSQSEKQAAKVLEAAEALSLTTDSSKDSKAGSKSQKSPTLDHLPPDDSPNAEKNAAMNKAREEGGGAGSFDRLSAMFGSGGLMRAGPG